MCLSAQKRHTDVMQSGTVASADRLPTPASNKQQACEPLLLEVDSAHIDSAEEQPQPPKAWVAVFEVLLFCRQQVQVQRVRAMWWRQQIGQ